MDKLWQLAVFFAVFWLFSFAVIFDGSRQDIWFAAKCSTVAALLAAVPGTVAYMLFGSVQVEPNELYGPGPSPDW